MMRDSELSRLTPARSRAEASRSAKQRLLKQPQAVFALTGSSPNLKHNQKRPNQTVFFDWWVQRDSNPRPPVCKTGALAS